MEASLFCACGQSVLEIVEEFGEGDGLDAAVGAAAFDAGVGEDVFDEVSEAVGFGTERGEVFEAFVRVGNHALLEHFGVHGDGGERGAEFVGDGGDEGAAAEAEGDSAPEEGGERAGSDDEADPGEEKSQPHGGKGIEMGEGWRSRDEFEGEGGESSGVGFG